MVVAKLNQRLYFIRYRITYSIHDQPSIVLPFERRQELEGIAKGPPGARELHALPPNRRVRTYLYLKAYSCPFPDTSTVNEPDLHEIDWLKSCASNSPARQGTFKQAGEML